MTKNDIITMYFKQGIIRDICLKFAEEKRLAEELTSEVYLALCEKPASYIQDINRRGKLLAVVWAMAKYIYQNPKGKFYRTFRSKRLQFRDNNTNIKSTDDEEEICN